MANGPTPRFPDPVLVHATAGRPDPERCVVLVPVASRAVKGCENGLRQLEQLGYEVRRVSGRSDVDLLRSEMATRALADGFDELMWVDSDIVFDPADVERLRGHGLPIACGLYAKKGRREFACTFLPGTDKIALGGTGTLTPLRFVGFGFVLVRRVVFETIRTQLALPACSSPSGSDVVPYFLPMTIPHGGEQLWYLAEDYAFCERARRCGFELVADTHIRLWHVGEYRFSWEDAGSEKERFANYSYTTGMPGPPRPG